MNKSVALSLVSLGLMLIRNSRVAPPLKLYGLESVIKTNALFWRDPKKISFSIKNPGN